MDAALPRPIGIFLHGFEWMGEHFKDALGVRHKHGDVFTITFIVRIKFAHQFLLLNQEKEPKYPDPLGNSDEDQGPNMTDEQSK